MQIHGLKDISNFYLAGVNYRKTDAEIRGQFAINNEQYASILEQAPSFGITEFFIVSTCNRTEIYGFAASASQLIHMLCSQTEGSATDFSSSAYVKAGWDAVEHFFHVGAGLDSQILGDYEIVGQIKLATKFAKQYGRIDVFTERMVNSMQQASKAIKNKTALSDGTVSVSFAAVQFIREQVKDIKNKNILLVGTGKIGCNTAKNLVDYLDTKNITLVNRTEEKASLLATQLGLKVAPVEELSQQIISADIILMATSSPEPTILSSQLKGLGQKLIIDFSIPHSVESSVKDLPNVVLLNVDELSKIKDNTLAKRQAEVPKAKVIIAEHMWELSEWYQMRKHVPVLKALKSTLKELHTSPLFIPLYDRPDPGSNAEEKIQRVINGMAIKLKAQNNRGCHYIEAINEFIATGTN